MRNPRLAVMTTSEIGMELPALVCGCPDVENMWLGIVELGIYTLLSYLDGCAEVLFQYIEDSLAV